MDSKELPQPPFPPVPCREPGFKTHGSDKAFEEGPAGVNFTGIVAGIGFWQLSQALEEAGQGQMFPDYYQKNIVGRYLAWRRYRYYHGWKSGGGDKGITWNLTPKLKVTHIGPFSGLLLTLSRKLGKALQYDSMPKKTDYSGWGNILLPPSYGGDPSAFLLYWILLIFALVTYIFFVVWSSIFLLIIWIVTLGKLPSTLNLWRLEFTFQTKNDINRIANAILRYGGVLSRAWEPYLTKPENDVALLRIRWFRHYRIALTITLIFGFLFPIVVIWLFYSSHIIVLTIVGLVGLITSTSLIICLALLILPGDHRILWID